MRQRHLIVYPLLLALAACGSKKAADPQESAADPEATATASPAAVAGDQQQLPLTAQAFVDAVSASDKFEIQSARIIQGSGPGQPLTGFSAMMLRDHQVSTNALRATLNQAGDVKFDDQKLTDQQKADLDALREARGPQRAALYKRQQLAAHEKALAVLKTYAASGDNQALMAFANKTIPVVSHHLAEVQNLP